METFKSPTTMKNDNHILTPAKLSPANRCICNDHKAMHIKTIKKVLHFTEFLNYFSFNTYT